MPAKSAKNKKRSFGQGIRKKKWLSKHLREAKDSKLLVSDKNTLVSEANLINECSNNDQMLALHQNVHTNQPLDQINCPTKVFIAKQESSPIVFDDNNASSLESSRQINRILHKILQHTEIKGYMTQLKIKRICNENGWNVDCLELLKIYRKVLKRRRVVKRSALKKAIRAKLQTRRLEAKSTRLANLQALEFYLKNDLALTPYSGLPRWVTTKLRIAYVQKTTTCYNETNARKLNNLMGYRSNNPDINTAINQAQVKYPDDASTYYNAEFRRQHPYNRQKHFAFRRITHFPVRRTGMMQCRRKLQLYIAPNRNGLRARLQTRYRYC